MPRNKAISHERIMKAAKKEFLEKGFEKASMRGIGAAAGMTQAALYRHFASKEDMFSALVEPALTYIYDKAKEYEEAAYRNIENLNPVQAIFARNNVEMIKDVVMKYRDEIRLVICCSSGTKYEDYIHDLVRKEQKIILKAIDYLRGQGIKIAEISEDELHIFLSAYITAIFEPIVHDWPIEKAMHGLDLIEEFFIPGWEHIFGC